MEIAIASVLFCRSHQCAVLVDGLRDGCCNLSLVVVVGDAAEVGSNDEIFFLEEAP